MARWKDWRGSTEALKREAREGIHEDGEAYGNQQHPENPKRKSSGKRWFNMPPANPPSDVTRNGSRATTKNIAEPRIASIRLIEGNPTTPVSRWSATGQKEAWQILANAKLSPTFANC